MYDYYINFLRNKNERNLFSFLIRTAENTPYNHVEISCEIPSLPSSRMFYSSVWPVSRAATQRLIDEHYTIVKRRKLKLKVTDDEAQENLHKELGRKYSLMQNIIIFLKLSVHCFKNLFNSFKLNLDKYLNCTEYCGLFLTSSCEIKKDFVSLETISLTELDCDEIGVLDEKWIPDEI